VEKLNVVTVVHHIEQMRSSQHAQLVRCSDGGIYVIKFFRTARHRRSLCNELFATLLAQLIGLPVAQSALAKVPSVIINGSPGLRGLGLRTAGEVAFASTMRRDYRAVVSCFDYLPECSRVEVRNLQAFAGMLAFDKWLGNAGRRQAVFARAKDERRYTATFIDHSDCFNGQQWAFSDDALAGTYPVRDVYAPVRDWSTFEPWLTRIEQLDPNLIRAVANSIPKRWYGRDRLQFEKLITNIAIRRGFVRQLIMDFVRSSPESFPNWGADGHALA